MPSSSGMRMSETMSWTPCDPVQHVEGLDPGAGLEAGEPLCLEHPDQGPSDPGLVIHDEAVGGTGHDRLRFLGTGHLV